MAARCIRRTAGLTNHWLYALLPLHDVGRIGSFLFGLPAATALMSSVIAVLRIGSLLALGQRAGRNAPAPEG